MEAVLDRVTPGADDFLDSIHDSAAANSIRATSPTSTPGLMHMLAYILDGFLVWAIANPGLFFLYSAIVLLPFALIVTYAMCQIRKAGTKFKKLRGMRQEIADRMAPGPMQLQHADSPPVSSTPSSNGAQRSTSSSSSSSPASSTAPAAASGDNVRQRKGKR